MLCESDYMHTLESTRKVEKWQLWANWGHFPQSSLNKHILWCSKYSETLRYKYQCVYEPKNAVRDTTLGEIEKCYTNPKRCSSNDSKLTSAICILHNIFKMTPFHLTYHKNSFCKLLVCSSTLVHKLKKPLVCCTDHWNQ